MKKGAILALFGVLGAMLLSGCGGGDEETTSLTRSQFIAQGNKICKRSSLERQDLIAAAQKLVKPGEEISDSAKEELIFTAFAGPYQKAIEELRELGLPSKGGQDAEALLDEMERAEKRVRKEPLVAITSISQFAKANEMAREFGLEDCAI